VRATAAESLLAGATPSDELWRSAANAAASPLEPGSDIHGSSTYRKHLAAVLAERALIEAHDRARTTR
jgi:carbon-monoxide dehydrogenase medium subunit